MASIADITIKKNDGTTDIVYVGVQPSSGDGTAAVWQVTAGGLAAAHRPELHLSARSSDAARKRALRSTFVYPQLATDSTTTITSVVQRAIASTNWTIPREMTQTQVDEFVTQYANLLAHTLLRTCVKSGYSAT